MAKISTTKSKESESGKLRIGDDWNAIRIIALSQSNPLKAIAEFVENCIDAHAKTIAITRGREHGEHYLMVKDDGDGVPRDPRGLPDFKYVATHICDSIKRRMKADGPLQSAAIINARTTSPVIHKLYRGTTQQSLLQVEE
jgi:Histidine kinase-, DNA gyrase B-, and HSP90-like ATPase